MSSILTELSLHPDTPEHTRAVQQYYGGVLDPLVAINSVPFLAAIWERVDTRYLLNQLYEVTVYPRWSTQAQAAARSLHVIVAIIGQIKARVIAVDYLMDLLSDGRSNESFANLHSPANVARFRVFRMSLSGIWEMIVELCHTINRFTSGLGQGDMDGYGRLAMAVMEEVGIEEDPTALRSIDWEAYKWGL